LVWYGFDEFTPEKGDHAVHETVDGRTRKLRECVSRSKR
jgi:hypothetical protein